MSPWPAPGGPCGSQPTLELHDCIGQRESAAIWRTWGEELARRTRLEEILAITLAWVPCQVPPCPTIFLARLWIFLFILAHA
ncbi:hypothetical protein SBV1_2290009 [Verrucomicrobia bacterium]|nr:hypothetical protein SBV1_2290009 [Verrucomicrobiota bacterium]